MQWRVSVVSREVEQDVGSSSFRSAITRWQHEDRFGESATVVRIEAPLDAGWHESPAWLLTGEVLVHNGEPVVVSWGAEVNQSVLDPDADPRALPDKLPPQNFQRQVTPARVLKAFRETAEGFEAMPARTDPLGGVELLRHYGFDPDAATAPVAPQRRGLKRHEELIRRVIELSEQGVDHPMRDAADELHVSHPRVRTIMCEAWVQGVVERVADRRGHYAFAKQETPEAR